MLLGPADSGFLSDALLRKDDSPNLEASFSRDMDRFPAGGGGGNCDSDVTLVAL